MEMTTELVRLRPRPDSKQNQLVPAYST